MAVAFMNYVVILTEIQQVPPLIKGGLDRARASLERRHENLQHHALDHAVVQQVSRGWVVCDNDDVYFTVLVAF